MARNRGNALQWPLEAAVLPPDDMAALCSPGSNLVLDLHGDPALAQLVVFSDGNHHMALADVLAAFARKFPEVGDVFYATTPPRVISEALKSGRISTGNLNLSLTPHIFISPGDVLDNLRQAGLVGAHKAVMRSTGLAILVARGNPKKIRRAADLLDRKNRLAISNPVTETASFTVYEAALCAWAGQEGYSESEVRDYLRGGEVVKSTVIHHREVPDILAADAADASLIYHHLALRYTRIFPDVFDLVELDMTELPDPERFITTYHSALVGDGGAYGRPFLEFFESDAAAEIYRSHGLRSAGDI